jgi:hypothetical protein
VAFTSELDFSLECLEERQRFAPKNGRNEQEHGKKRALSVRAVHEIASRMEA